MMKLMKLIADDYFLEPSMNGFSFFEGQNLLYLKINCKCMKNAKKYIHYDLES